MPRLPTFYIAGAMRCGTSSLNSYLREHPQIAVSRPKEVHFYDREYHRGLAWYLRHFPDADHASAIGEATPDYLYVPEALRRMADTTPEARVLIMLRDPVDRAYSHYWHNRSRGKEHLSFEEALAAEPERIAGGEDARVVFSYADRGRYARQLESLFAVFDERAVLIQSFAELEADPASVYGRTLRFLGVDEGFTPEGLGRPVNAHVEFRSTTLRRLGKHLPRPLRTVTGRVNQVQSEGYPPMEPATRRRLEGLFEEESRHLEALLGTTAPWALPADEGQDHQ